MTGTGCSFGEHLFEWAGSTTSENHQPPDYQRCKCGRYTWGELDRLLYEAEWDKGKPVATSGGKGKG